MLETTVCTFDVNVPYDEWVKKFDIDEAPARSAKGIKVIFRGVSKDNPEKAIVVVQALEGVLENIYKRTLKYLKKMVQS